MADAGAGGGGEELRGADRGPRVRPEAPGVGAMAGVSVNVLGACLRVLPPSVLRYVYFSPVLNLP